MNKSMDNYESEEFVPAMYTSVWDDGTELTTACRLDLVNLRVYDIEDSGDDEDHGCLVSEYVEYMKDRQLERIEEDDLMFDYKDE